MHGLAIILSGQGNHITGSDDQIYDPAASRLKNHQLLPPLFGWFPEKITPDIDVVVFGMDIKKDNPELVKAQEIGLRIYSCPEYILEQSREKTRVVIAGSQGKATITSMVLHVMKYHHRTNDYVMGASAPGADNTVQLSEENDFIVLEGDEYLSSAIDPRPKFHLYEPNIALLSGIELDHTNIFPSYEKYVDQFRIFIDSIVKGGILVYNEEDPVVKKLVEESKNEIRKHPYRRAEYQISDEKTFLNTPEGEMPVNVFGEQNMQNISGAKWICQHMGIDEDDFYEAISCFQGVSKE